MGNQNMLINLSIFAFIIYLAFIVSTHLSSTSFTKLVGLKSYYVTSQSQSDAATGNGTDITRDIVSHLRISLTPVPTSTLPYKYIKRTDDQMSFQLNTSMITLKLEGKTEAENLGWSRDLEEQIINTTDKLKTSKSYPPCRKRILFWCEDAIGILGKYRCKKSQCEVKITRSVNVKDLQNADAVVFYHMIEKPWADLIRQENRFFSAKLH